MDTLKTECDQCGTNNNIKQKSNGNVGTNKNPDIKEETETMFQCEDCNKEFSKKVSLRRHIATVHKEKPIQPILPLELLQCSFEGCTFETYFPYNLKRHNLKVHENSKGKPMKVMQKCSQCEKKFSDQRNLRFHMRKIHNTGKLVLEIKRQCPLCPFTSTEHEKKMINSHFEDYHGIPMVWENLQLNSMTEFIDWKKDLEKLTTTYYVRAFCTTSMLRFQCHRSGWYKKKGFDKRRLKASGSCKINAFCPSGITVNISENNVINVSYLATHVGHTKELEHIPMTREERSAMKTQRARRRSRQVVSTKQNKDKNEAPVDTAVETPVKRSNAEIEMEKLMMEVQKDIEECQEDIESEPTIFLEHVADVHPSTVECLNLQNSMVENCHIMVLEPAVISCIDLEAEKNKFLESFIRCINEDVHSLSDLEYVKQHCQTILPSLRDPGPSQVSVITEAI